MKRICLLILCVVTVFSFTGCRRQEEEEAEVLIDYDAMDEKVGQNQESAEARQVPFEDELADIRAAAQEYVSYLIKNDADGYAEAMPEVYLTAIQKYYEYSRDEAVKYLAGQIRKEIFENFALNHTSLSRLREEYGFSMTLSKVARYSNESAVIDEYKKLGITVTDIAVVNFKVIVDDSAVSSSMRFAKLDTGEWKADMSVFKP